MGLRYAYPEAGGLELAEEVEEEPSWCHRICMCQENLALCGRDVTDEPLYEYDEMAPEPDCPACVDVTPTWVCPVCQYYWN
jgi:hypothetical protein